MTSCYYSSLAAYLTLNITVHRGTSYYRIFKSAITRMEYAQTRMMTLDVGANYQMWIRHWVGALSRPPVVVDESGLDPVDSGPEPKSRWPSRLLLPASVDPRPIVWGYAGAVADYHMIA